MIKLRRPDIGLDVDALDGIRCDTAAVRCHDFRKRIERAVRVAAGGMALEIVARDFPTVPELRRHHGGLPIVGCNPAIN